MNTTQQPLPKLAMQASKYFARGFTAKEIGKQLDTAPRTVQRWITQYNFASIASPEPLQTKISQLHKQGFSYTQIAKKCNVCKATVYNHVKKIRSLENI